MAKNNRNRKCSFGKRKENTRVITSIGGQKGRVAGYMKENTFYIVFLDKNHQFWITEKKHT